eukprot:CAMPEP_0197232552 /NCGR_PEP_ID=MMETSP1429-20130617/813_1 /TAXON_ID=49237 /ORGANISM="Chaetoceros  sp., Strain UNC1202" /LENGTH=77 /DNA_ID=CAMNT_0042690615 /DNA_START=68 /DNA_END=301 /DNA_ORIENTATION=+
MKGSITAITALALVATTSAFAPATPTFTRAATPLNAEAEKKELVLDTNFEEVNLVRLLGLKKARKIARKNKRKKGGD